MNGIIRPWWWICNFVNEISLLFGGGTKSGFISCQATQT
jgi:hypothetical protein